MEDRVQYLERNSPMKKFAALLMVLSACVFTVGCNAKSGSTKSESVKSKTEPVDPAPAPTPEPKTKTAGEEPAPE